MNQKLANRDALEKEEWETRRRKGDSLQKQKIRKPLVLEETKLVRFQAGRKKARKQAGWLAKLF